MNHNRLSILQRIITLRGVRSYLEIGCYRDEVFKEIKVPRKVGVDPLSGGTIRCSSDVFFANTADKFDLIFIDGDHRHAQVLKDIRSALKCLTARGVIVVHDCLPSCEQEQLESNPGGAWTGDVWKAIVDLRSDPDLDICVLRCDYGCGVIIPRTNPGPVEPPAELTWAGFTEHKAAWLNLQPPSALDEFVLREMPPAPPRRADVAVIIPCHNYGCFLAEAIDSVLAQDLLPMEILVVDDNSTDDTPRVAARYASRGVRYMRVENGSVHTTRGDGFRATTAKFVCFLDADDHISRNYLSAALEILESDTHWRTGFVYTDVHQFGASKEIWSFIPAVIPDNLEARNNVHCAAVVRRQALEIAQVFDTVLPPTTHEDWWMWRQLVRRGWQGQKSAAILHYRKHIGGSKINRVQQRTFCHSSNSEKERVSLLIMTGGGRRAWAWEQTRAFLERQTWPHDQISLVIGDTAQDPEFSRQIREWLLRCDYTDVRHIQMAIGAPDLASANRREQDVAKHVDQAVCRGLTRMTRGLDTAWTWILEDDTLPPDDALPRLMSRIMPDVGAVCAPYKSRQHEGSHWLVFQPHNEVAQLGLLLRDIHVGMEPNRTVSQVAGSGFGCLLVRSHFLRRHPFGAHGMSPWYDPSFFQANNIKTLCDWSIVCKHFGAPDKYY